MGLGQDAAATTKGHFGLITRRVLTFEPCEMTTGPAGRKMSLYLPYIHQQGHSPVPSHFLDPGTSTYTQ